MLKKIALFAILGMCAVALVANAQSASTTQPQPGSSQDTADSAKENKSTGKVDKIDTLAKTIAVKVEPSNEVRVFTFDDKTTFHSKGKSIKVDTLKVGDKVEIESDTGNVAMKVTVLPATETKSEN
jgi:Cu/Ag efflux protein CusF